jgi:hypothetical protein
MWTPVPAEIQGFFAKAAKTAKTATSHVWWVAVSARVRFLVHFESDFPLFCEVFLVRSAQRDVARG